MGSVEGGGALVMLSGAPREDEARYNGVVTPHDLIFANLNEKQCEAVHALQGPVLILAGAGSGKTRALTHRIAHLIARGVPAWQILAVTFTNKAANEMKERIANLLQLTGEQVSSPHLKSKVQSPTLPVMGTFHSVCVRILRRDSESIGRDRNFVIFDTDDQETLMKEVLGEMKIDPKELKARTALGHIGRLKCEAMSIREAMEQATTEWMVRMVKIYELYQGKLRSQNALDFDDLILETVRLFREAPNVLDRYQETWRFLNIDEYQDTNHAQYLLISLLAQKYRNLCVIGDPDQSIYGFRGADIRNILQFKQEYPNALAVKLERNYRSTQPILDCADAIIAANPNRPQKKMWTSRNDGEKTIVHDLADEKREAAEAVKLVLEALARGMPLREQVILYRTNAQSRLFEEACMRASLPYRLVGGVKFYARREVKDVLAYLHAIYNPANSIALLRIINVPSRKIGKTTVEALLAFSEREKCAFWDALQRVREIPELADPVKTRLTAFVTLLHTLAERSKAVTVATLTRDLLASVGMEQWIKDGTGEGEERWENIGELLSVMGKYDALEPALSLTSFLEEVALVSEVDKLMDEGSDALTLMTLHLCKGLEFQHVIIAGCEEGILPHSSALFNREQLEEERRLLYVGMTRSKDILRLLTTRSRMLWGNLQGNAPSRFLDDLPPEKAEWKSNDMMSPLFWKGKGDAAVSSRLTSSSQKGRLHQGIKTSNLEFNQDVFTEEISQERMEALTQGARISHPAFGIGIITSRRGDIVEIAFDSGAKKRFALSIAPLTLVS